MALYTFHSRLSTLEFDTFFNDYGIRNEFGLELLRPNNTVRDFPEGKIGVYTRFFEFDKIRLPLSTFFMRILSYFRIHISQLSVLGASQISHFEISCRAHGCVPTIHLFHRFYLAVSLPTMWITIVKGVKNKNTIVPTCHNEPFDSLKGWRDKLYWVNDSVAPISIRWFTGGEFPQDFAVDRMDGDMVLKTFLNDNSIRIRIYPKEFLVLIGLSRLVYTPVACLAFYDETDKGREEKLLENERHVLERIADVVTSPYDQIVKLGAVSVNQMLPAAALPSPIDESNSGVVAAGESALKDGATRVGSGETPMPLSFDFVPPATASKVEEFVPSISFAPSKWLSYVQGASKKSGVSKKPISKKGHMVVKLP
nr:hypothetical protein [Tanacetum cinerariifolium]